jgi:hypothetical protein
VSAQQIALVCGRLNRLIILCRHDSVKEERSKDGTDSEWEEESDSGNLTTTFLPKKKFLSILHAVGR